MRGTPQHCNREQWHVRVENKLPTTCPSPQPGHVYHGIPFLPTTYNRRLPQLAPRLGFHGFPQYQNLVRNYIIRVTLDVARIIVAPEPLLPLTPSRSLINSRKASPTTGHSTRHPPSGGSPNWATTAEPVLAHYSSKKEVLRSKSWISTTALELSDLQLRIGTPMDPEPYAACATATGVLLSRILH
jgi:hypothetical protein